MTLSDRLFYPCAPQREPSPAHTSPLERPAHARQLPDRPARGSRGRPRHQHPRRVPRPDRSPRSPARDLGRCRWSRRAFAGRWRPPDVRPEHADLRGPGSDRRNPVDPGRGPRHLDDLLDGSDGPAHEVRAAPASRRSDRRGRRSRVRDGAAGGRTRRPRDRAVPVGRSAGLRPDHDAAARSRAGSRDRRDRRLGVLPRCATPQPAAVLRLDRRLPDRRVGGRPGVRHPRPPGGRHPARPEQPRLRRLGGGAALRSDRYGPEGGLQLLAGHDLAGGRRVGVVPRPDDVPLLPHRVGLEPARDRFRKWRWHGARARHHPISTSA